MTVNTIDKHLRGVSPLHSCRAIDAFAQRHCLLPEWRNKQLLGASVLIRNLVSARAPGGRLKCCVAKLVALTSSWLALCGGDVIKLRILHSECIAVFLLCTYCKVAPQSTLLIYYELSHTLHDYCLTSQIPHYAIDTLELVPSKRPLPCGTGQLYN